MDPVMTFLMDEPALIVDQEDEGEADGEGEILTEPEGEEDEFETASDDDTADM